MHNSPNPAQQRITEQINLLLKSKDAPMEELWRLWKEESNGHADEFAMVLIGNLCSTNALLRLRNLSK